MLQFTYTSQTWDALTDTPKDRSASLSELAQLVSGRLICFCYSLGEHDGLAILDLPDESAAKVILVIGQGAVCQKLCK